MRTAQHRLYVPAFLLFAGPFCAGIATIIIDTAKSGLRGNPNIYDIFPGEIAEK